MTEIIFPIVAIGGMGVIFGALLAIASKIFEVKKDERIPMVLDLLPGANCGGCGYAGCSAYAEAMVLEGVPTNYCPSCSDEAIKKISEILGRNAEKRERNVAFVMCSGTHGVAKEVYTYEGRLDCHTAIKLGGGHKSCSFGCIGFGSCISKCSNDAISIKNGIAVVEKEKCYGCGACVIECPKNIIKLFPYETEYQVFCSSNDKGKQTRQVCSTGCIGCGICAKNCPENAIELSDNLAIINPDKCVKCGICSEKCPQKVIHNA